MEEIKVIRETFRQFFFQRNTLCHSFQIIVIPAVLLSFFRDYRHFFQIIVIPSILVSFIPNIVISTELLPLEIFVILNHWKRHLEL